MGSAPAGTIGLSPTLTYTYRIKSTYLSDLSNNDMLNPINIVIHHECTNAAVSNGATLSYNKDYYLITDGAQSYTDFPAISYSNEPAGSTCFTVSLT